MISLLGIFGYSFQKEFLKAKFWKFFLVFVIGWDIFVTIYSIRDMSEMSDSMLIIGGLIIYIVVLIPKYIGLYLYAYKYSFKTPNKNVERNNLP